MSVDQRSGGINDLSECTRSCKSVPRLSERLRPRWTHPRQPSRRCGSDAACGCCCCCENWSFGACCQEEPTTSRAALPETRMTGAAKLEGWWRCWWSCPRKTGPDHRRSRLAVPHRPHAAVAKTTTWRPSLLCLGRRAKGKADLARKIERAFESSMVNFNNAIAGWIVILKLANNDSIFAPNGIVE